MYEFFFDFIIEAENGQSYHISSIEGGETYE